MKRLLFTVCCALCTLGALSAQGRPRLAMLPFTGGSGGDGETIAMLLANQNELRNNFTIVLRTSNVDAIVREQRFQQSGITDRETFSRINEFANAEYVVSGHIAKLGSRNLVLVSIINVKSYQQIAGVYEEYGTVDEIRSRLPGMAQRLAAAVANPRRNLPKLAVAPFTVPPGVRAADAEILAQILAADIANSGKYAVLARTSAITAAQAEQKIQRSGATNKDTIIETGKVDNAVPVKTSTSSGKRKKEVTYRENE